MHMPIIECDMPSTVQRRAAHGHMLHSVGPRYKGGILCKVFTAENQALALYASVKYIASK